MMGELLVGAVPAVYYETVQSAFSAVEDAGESDAAGAAAADILEAFVDMLQPGSPLGTWLAGAIVNECCGGAVVLAPLTRTHAQTRAVSIRLLTALMPRSRDVAAAAGADDSDVMAELRAIGKPPASPLGETGRSAGTPAGAGASAGASPAMSAHAAATNAATAAMASANRRWSTCIPVIAVRPSTCRRRNPTPGRRRGATTSS